MNLTNSLTRRAFSTRGLAGLATLCLAGQSFGQEPGAIGKFVSANEEKANVKVVEDFCAAWGKKDLDKIASSLADDCSFRVNQKSPPVVGKEMVMDRFRNDLGKASIDIKILKTAALGPIVLTRRHDAIAPANGKAPLSIQIAAGMFFVDNGKIVKWTDFELK